MTNVFYLAIEFPPLANAGVYRSLKFVKYLRNYGINPIVLTLTIESSIDVFGKNLDYELLNELPDEIEIYRIPCPSIKPYYSNRFKEFKTIYFSIKDIIAMLWRKEVFKLTDTLFPAKSPKILISTLPPFSAGKLGVQISERYAIPYLLDMRDGWSTWRIAPYGSYLHFWLTKKEENYIFRKSQKIIGTTPELVEIFQKDHNNIEKSKFICIPNGFDTEIGTSSFSVPSYKLNGKIKIGYVGAFYYSPQGREDIFKPWWRKNGYKMMQYIPVKEDWLYRSPFYFFKILEGVLKKNPILRDYVELNFIGAKPVWMDDMLSDFELPISITFHGQKPHNECSRLIQTYDLLLVTGAKRLGGRDWALPSKIFDYVANQKVVLGVLPEGATRNFILSTNTGIVLDPDDISDSIISFSKLLETGIELEVDGKELYKYKRSNTAKSLASLLKKMTN